MRFILTMCLVGILALAGIILADSRMSGHNVISKIESFHHWTIQKHWTSPEFRQVTVLLDEAAVEGRDTTCEATLDMLDALTRIIPRSWTVRLISPTGWVPARWNPIDRDGVEWMWSDYRREDEERPGELHGPPPPAYMFTHRTATSH